MVPCLLETLGAFVNTYILKLVTLTKIDTDNKERDMFATNISSSLILKNHNFIKLSFQSIKRVL